MKECSNCKYSGECYQECCYTQIKIVCNEYERKEYEK